MPDSLIRLRQLNSGEIGPWVLSLINQSSISISGTGILTGEFYPLRANPSGYLTNSGGFITTGQTGNFVTNSALVGSNSNLLVTVSGLYYPLSNPSGFITGNQSGAFYPYTGNPSQFVIPSQTGLFVRRDEYALYDSALSFSADWQNRQLYASSNRLAADWENGTLFNPSDSSSSSLDWVFGHLKSGNRKTVDWKNQTLSTGSSASHVTLNWGKKTLSGNWDAQGLTIKGVAIFTGSGSFYQNSNPSGYIGSGQLLSGSGHLQNQIEDLRIDLFNTGNYTVKNFVNKSGFILYDENSSSSINWNAKDLYYSGTSLSWKDKLLYSKIEDNYTLDWNTGRLYDQSQNISLDWLKRQLSGDWLIQNAKINGSQVLTVTSGNSLYYSISNPNNYATQSYVGANFAPLNDYVSLSSPTSNVQLKLYDSKLNITPLSYKEGQYFFLSGSGGRGILDVYGSNYTGNSTIDVKRILGLTGNIGDFYADNIFLGGVPIKQAISGTPATGSLLSMIDDNHNTRLALYDTGSLTNRFYLGSGRNDAYYLQYYYVYPNTSTVLKSSIDLANQSIQGFNISSSSITVGGSNVVTASQTGNFVDKTSYILKDSLSNYSIDWGTRILYDPVQNPSIRWEGRQLATSLEDRISINWESGHLYNYNTINTISGISLNWFERQLSGNWEAQGLKVSGSNVITSSQTGSLLSNYAKLGGSTTSNNNFALYDISRDDTALEFRTTGVFYLQKPASATKIDIDKGLITNFSGQFLSLSMSGSPVTTGGPYYLASNPSNYAKLGYNTTNTNFNLFNEGVENFPFYCDQGMVFYLQSSLDLSKKIDVASGTINNFSGNFTTLKWSGNSVLTGFNSGLYVTTGQTGNFVDRGQTGSFVTASNTGNLTGEFYPLRTNPSGYLTGFNSGLYALSSQTGSFITTGQTGQFAAKGLSGYIPQFKNNGTGLIESVIFASSNGCIGINNSAPTAGFAIDINGSGKISAGALQFGTVNLTNTNLDFRIGSSSDGGANFRLLPYLGHIYFDNTLTNGYTYFRNVDRINMAIADNGSVGIKTGTPNYTLDVNGNGNFVSGLFIKGNPVSTGALAFLSQSSSYTLNFSNDVILANSTSASVLLSLPAASSVSGKLFRIKRINSGSFNVIVSGNYIDGETGVTLPNRFASLSVISDGSGYYTF